MGACILFGGSLIWVVLFRLGIQAETEIEKTIKKILNADYPRGKPRGISPSLFQQKAENRIFIILPLSPAWGGTSPLKIRGDY